MRLAHLGYRERSPTPPSIAEANLWLRDRPTFAPVDARQESEIATGEQAQALADGAEALERIRLLGSSRPGEKGEDPRDRDLDEATEELRHVWYRHAGYGPDSAAGGIRHAARDLFPHAGPLRAGHERCDRHAEFAAVVARQFTEAQQILCLLGIRTLTLYRGVHAVMTDRGPVTQRVLGGVANGALATASGRVDGEFVGKPVVSVLDGWTTRRRVAQGWAKWTYGSGLRCVMAAEVQSWEVASWGSLAVGDSPAGAGGPQEVIVLGGKGEVRWEVKGILDPSVVEAMGADGTLPQAHPGT